MELISGVGHVEFRFSPFGDIVSVSARQVHGLHWYTIGIEMILDTHDGLLGDEAQVEARFGPFGDRATLDARLVQGLRQTYRRLRNSIKGTRWNS
jgi:hypothetical protein